MTNRPKLSMSEQMNTAQVAIRNSLGDAEIRGLVGQFGYSEAKLNEGEALYAAALSAVDAQRLKVGAQQEASRTLEQAERSAKDAYQSLAKVARAVFVKDKGRLTALGLVGEMPLSLAGFLAAAYVLFDNARNLPALEEFGYSSERLESERAKVAAFDSANQAQEAAKGAAQQSTREQDAALQALTQWTVRYVKIARVALRGRSQLLEKIGVAARTSKPKKKDVKDEG